MQFLWSHFVNILEISPGMSDLQGNKNDNFINSWTLLALKCFYDPWYDFLNLISFFLGVTGFAETDFQPSGGKDLDSFTQQYGFAWGESAITGIVVLFNYNDLITVNSVGLSLKKKKIAFEGCLVIS